MPHEKYAPGLQKRAPMIRYQSQKQLTLAEFGWPFQTALDEFCERLKQDRYVLAAVLIGSLTTETVWRKDSLSAVHLRPKKTKELRVVRYAHLPGY